MELPPCHQTLVYAHAACPSCGAAGSLRAKRRKRCGGLLQGASVELFCWQSPPVQHSRRLLRHTPPVTRQLQIGDAHADLDLLGLGAREDVHRLPGKRLSQ